MSPSRKRWRPRRGLVIGLGFVMLWLGLVIWSVATAVGASRSAEKDLRLAMEQVSEVDSAASDNGRLVVDTRLLSSAADGFRRAESRLSLPWVMPLRIVPFIGRQVTALRDLARAAADVTHVAESVSAEGQELIGAGWQDPTGRPLLLRELARVSARALEDLDGVDPGPGEALIGPLQRRYDTFVTEYARLERSLGIASAVGAVAADVLQGPQQTLVLAANNAEMRNGAGMFLSAGVVETVGGQIGPIEMLPTSQMSFPPDSVNLDPDVEEVWGWLDMKTDVRNQGATPRFDTTARQVSDMWAAATGTIVDNVVSADVRTLGLLFEATGGVDLGTAAFDASTIEDYLLHDQYGEFEDPRSGARFEQLGNIAAAVLASMGTGDFAPVQTLRALEEAVSGRHLIMWSRDPRQQAAWEAGGLAGTVEAGDLSLGIINRGANKLDWLLDVDAEIVIGEPYESDDGTIRRRGEVIVTLRNTARDGEVTYVAGPNVTTDLDYGDYLGLVTVYVPEIVKELDLRSRGKITVSGQDGASNVAAAPSLVPMGHSRTMRFSFTVPESGSLVALPSGRYPNILWRFGEETWQDREPHRVEW